ncbi:UDP-glucuronosyltransferase 1-2-like [Achroia grisella]|uniref:UDP-glucuronosyltransferase 1-2-like n=1 Tax=Achroia grisella TaxID=688607 RepID=UPI0027D262B8|nr:UDP-glucuronosyltransferase 1-2-like [Achroia grisella]
MLSAPIDSHQIAMRPVPQELAKRGSNVVIVTPLPAFTNGSVPSNLIEIDMKYTTDNVSKRLMEYVTDNNIFDTKSQKEIFSKYTTNICNAQLKSKEVQKLIKDGKRSYDVVLFEAGGRMNTVLAHLFNVPTIRLSSLGGHFDELNTLGGVVHPLFYPEHMQQRLYNLTLWEKLNNMFNHFCVMFLNVHRIWADNQPVPPSIIFYGEIDRGPHKELSQDLKNYLDTSENGVIYVSFGTTVSTTDLPTDKLQMFMNVLSEMPYNILWKSRKNQFSDIPRNIKVLEWVPQSELLKHPNMKLFITQGGIHSTHEAIAAEVPLIAVPIIGDQCYNAEKYRYHKIGDMINFHTVTAEIFRKTIETVLSDER